MGNSHLSYQQGLRFLPRPTITKVIGIENNGLHNQHHLVANSRIKCSLRKSERKILDILNKNYLPRYRATKKICYELFPISLKSLLWVSLFNHLLLFHKGKYSEREKVSPDLYVLSVCLCVWWSIFVYHLYSSSQAFGILIAFQRILIFIVFR